MHTKQLKGRFVSTDTRVGIIVICHSWIQKKSLKFFAEKERVLFSNHGFKVFY